MKTTSLYNDMPYAAKEDIGFPMNYMQLSRVQQEFVESLAEAVVAQNVLPSLDLKESLQNLNEDLLSINEEIVRLVNELG